MILLIPLRTKLRNKNSLKWLNRSTFWSFQCFAHVHRCATSLLCERMNHNVSVLPQTMEGAGKPILRKHGLCTSSSNQCQWQRAAEHVKWCRHAVTDRQQCVSTHTGVYSNNEAFLCVLTLLANVNLQNSNVTSLNCVWIYFCLCCVCAKRWYSPVQISEAASKRDAWKCQSQWPCAPTSYTCEYRHWSFNWQAAFTAEAVQLYFYKKMSQIFDSKMLFEILIKFLSLLFFTFNFSYFGTFLNNQPSNWFRNQLSH